MIHVTRRGFLKRSALAVGAVAIGQTVNLCSAQPWRFLHTEPAQLSINFLIEHYQTFCYGNWEPTLILTSFESWRSTQDLFLASQRFHDMNSPHLGSFKFMNADVAWSSKVPNGEFWFINEKPNADPRCSGRVVL